MANIVYREMPTPWELSQQFLAPGQKLKWKSPMVEANFWCKSLLVHEGKGGDGYGWNWYLHFFLAISIQHIIGEMVKWQHQFLMVTYVGNGNINFLTPLS